MQKIHSYSTVRFQRVQLSFRNVYAQESRGYFSYPKVATSSEMNFLKKQKEMHMPHFDTI